MEQDPTTLTRGRKLELSEAALIALVPLFFYGVAFCNEAGVVAYYGLPMGVVNVGIGQIVIPFAYVAFFALYLLVADEALHAQHPAWWPRIPASIKACALALPALLIVAILIKLPIHALIVLTPGAIVLSAAVIALRRRPLRRIQLYVDAIRGLRLLEAALLLLTTVCIVFVIGYAMASSQENFLVVSGSPERVVLRVYGDRAICATVDRAAHKIYQEYSFLDLARDPSDPMRLRKEWLPDMKLAQVTISGILLEPSAPGKRQLTSATREADAAAPAISTSSAPVPQPSSTQATRKAATSH